MFGRIVGNIGGIYMSHTPEALGREFSEYEIDSQYIKFNGETTGIYMDCVGTCTTTMDSRTVTKNNRGTPAKTATKGKGSGSMKESIHVPEDFRDEAFGLKDKTLNEDVRAYGASSRHKEFSLSQHVVNEDGKEKLKHYPRCVVTNMPEGKTENGADEVSESELEIAIMPDEYGNGVYEVILTDKNRTKFADWMENFSREMIAADV